MKRIDKLLNIFIIFAILGIAVVVYFKFIIKPSVNLPFQIGKIDKIRIFDLMEKELYIGDIVSKTGKETYCLIFDIYDCLSCIEEGLKFLNELDNTKANLVAVAIHDMVEEVNGWKKHYCPNFSSLYLITREEYAKKFKGVPTPIIVEFTVPNFPPIGENGLSEGMFLKSCESHRNFFEVMFRFALEIVEMKGVAYLKDKLLLSNKI